MPSGKYPRKGIARGNYKIENPFEKSCPSWTKTILYLAEHGDDWVPRGKLAIDSPNGERAILAKTRGLTSSSSWDKIKNSLMKFKVIKEKDITEQYDRKSYKLDRYWDEILKTISVLVDEIIQDTKKFPKSLGVSKSPAMVEFKKKHKELIKGPSEDFREWLLGEIKQYFKGVYNKRRFNKSIKELLHEFILARGDINAKIEGEYGVQFHYFAEAYFSFYQAKPEWLIASKFVENMAEEAKDNTYEVKYVVFPKTTEEKIIAEKDSIEKLNHDIQETRKKIMLRKDNIKNLEKSTNRRTKKGN